MGRDDYTIKQGMLTAYNGKDENVVIPDEGEITVVWREAFSYNLNIKSVVLPRGVESIESEAFQGCENLASVTISDTVTNIEANAFGGCKSLRKVFIPASVKHIAGGAFSGCEGLEKFEVDKENAFYRVESNCIIDNQTNIVIAGCKTSKIPSGIVGVGPYAFSGCKLKKIRIPESVFEVGDGAFMNCKKLKSVYFHEGTEIIDEYAFYGCDALEQISLPNTLNYVGGSALFLGDKLQTVEYGNLKYIGNATNPYLYLIGANEDLVVERAIVKKGCKIIGPSALYWCLELSKIKIPRSVIFICESAISNLFDLITIYGEEGSVAQTYANEYEIQFKPLFQS
jgi:hypothetical protein